MAQTISIDYVKQQQTLHQSPTYGVASVAFAPLVRDLIEVLGPGSLCDYGAGKKRLQQELTETYGIDVPYAPYDPAFPEYGPPRSADLVCCIDVLEHIEPDYLDAVLDELKALTAKWGFFTVHTGPAQKVLADGRNAHLIQQQPDWWLAKLGSRFEIRHRRDIEDGFYVVVSPKAA